MYKVFIVEDEIVVREGIRNSIPWDKTPYSLTGEAPDGEMALPAIKDIKPDILITDIRMPFMDGLALSRIVKKTLPWIKIIILSGHDEFEYARTAISIGVEEYLLKPVSAQDMLKALNKVADKIDEEKKELLSIEHLRQQIESHSEVLREKWLFEFVNDEALAADAIEKARELGIDLIARSYISVVIGVISPPEKTAQLLPVKRIIKTITEKYTNVMLFQDDDKKYGMLVKTEPKKPSSLEASSSLEAVEELVYSIAQAIKYEVERNTECKIAIGIGPQVERLRDIHTAYRKADQIVKRQAALGLFLISDGANLPSEEQPPDQAYPLITIKDDVLLTKFRYASKKDIDSIIEEYTKPLMDISGENEILEYFIFGEILMAVSKILEEFNGDIKEVIPFSLDLREIKNITKSKKVFFQKIKEIFNAVIEFRDSRIGGRYQMVVLKAKDFIDHHYSDQDISLHTTASYVAISPNHLSTVFSQEMGETFIEYLTNVRIEKAKHLLAVTGMKSVDIACETGFSDPHYFSFIFKKHTGLSPREYRQNSKERVKKD